MNKEYFRSLWYRLSAKQRHLIRYLYFLPTDIKDTLTNNRHKFVPPKGYIYTGYPVSSKAFLEQSNHHLKLLKTYTNIQPNDTVLDIGSGIGRTAISLTNYLSKKGIYEGFDVVKLGVDWCNSKIKKEHPNFNFSYIPLHNDLYNTSKMKAENFQFPYHTNYFDLVFTFSVFTHMQINEIQNYLKEINRVLDINGIVFSTFFLYDENDEQFIATKNTFNFPIKKNGYRLMHEKVKSGNIALTKTKLNNMMTKENLTIIKIIDGFWKGNHNSPEYQDIVIFKKSNSIKK